MHTLPMGSSNMGVVITGDIEAQQSNPTWFVDHKYMLRRNQEGEVNALGYFILKVPEHFRQPSTAFSPQGWRFGLHNRENLDNSGSEALKLKIAIHYGLVEEKWDHFCDAIVDDPKAMLACYGLQKGVSSWTNEQIKHILALDALFLAIFIDTQLPKDERRLWMPNTLPSMLSENDVFYARMTMWMDIMHHDLLRVESQIPYVLIDKVAEYISTFVASQTSRGNNPFIGDLQYQQRSIERAVKIAASNFMDTSGEAFKIDNSSLFGEKIHILGATYNAICGFKGLSIKSVRRSEYLHIPSATMLDQSGIKFRRVDGPLCTMSYEKKCLSLPKMRIYDGTSSFIRNMAWYENRSISNGCLFHDYIFIMSDLIQTPKDLELLDNQDVIDNPCGTKGFEMWITLTDGLGEIHSSQSHHDMKKAIKSRCGCKRYSLWSEFKIVFCSKPWLVLSTIAVVLVTVSTLVQTYIAIIGSNKMKPKFP